MMNFESQVNKLIEQYREQVRLDFQALAAMIYRNENKDFEKAKAKWLNTLVRHASTNEARWSGGLASAKNMEETLVREVAIKMAANMWVEERQFQQWLKELEEKEGQEQNGST